LSVFVEYGAVTAEGAEDGEGEAEGTSVEDSPLEEELKIRKSKSCYKT
jgi:hypothetical protein